MKVIRWLFSFITVHKFNSIKNKLNILGNVYLFITCIIYQVYMIPSSEQYFEKIYFSIPACHKLYSSESESLRILRNVLGTILQGVCYRSLR